jgi:thioredoxin-dependent adenylylsulfate APS reductase
VHEVASEPAAIHELEAAASRFEGRAAEALAWAAERFAGRVAFATGFGAEGCVVIDLIARERLAIEVFTLDTGLLFPETYALWRRLEERYDLTISAVRPAQTLWEQARAHGEALWHREPDSCCALRKLEPLRQALAGQAAWVSAIRREQTKDRAGVRVVEWDERFGLVKLNPLAGWTHAEVWSYVATRRVPVSPLHARGYASIGCEPCTSPVKPGEDPRAGRWRGREKTECGLHARPANPAVPLRLARPEGA